MTEKNYPTRMHEVLGVETGQVFYFETTSGLYQEYVLDAKGHLFRNHKTQRIESPRTMVDIINHPERITRRPRLTEEQEAQLKALDSLGFKWLAKDENDEVAAFKGRPDKGRGQWQDGGEYIVLYPFMPTNCLMDLPDWSDPAPFDIVQVLRENGVEVEG